MKLEDIAAWNRTAWDHEVEAGNRWTVPVAAEVIEAARAGEWSVVLTPKKAVPGAWFSVSTGSGLSERGLNAVFDGGGRLNGLRVLGLACGGGQQGPILAAAGAAVTVLDNSPAQLAQDRLVAEREGLAMTLVEGDMRDLGAFGDGAFDLIFHPVSNCFVPDVRPVWEGCHRVLRPGGVLLAGMTHPAAFLFDDAALGRGELLVRHRLPYSDLESLSAEEVGAYIARNEPLMFGHTFEDLVGAQLAAGFAMTGFYEDVDPTSVLGGYMPTYFATRCVRLP